MQLMLDMGKEQDCLRRAGSSCWRWWRCWLRRLPGVELGEVHPVVDLRPFARRNPRLNAGAGGGPRPDLRHIVPPLWLQQHMGSASPWAGLVLAPVGLLAIALSPWVGHNVSRIDPRKLTTVAFLGFAAILWMRAQFNTQADFGTILLPTLLQGIAMAFFFIPLQAIPTPGCRRRAWPRPPG